MRAMVLETVGQPLRPMDLPLPDPGPGEIRIRVEACAVCRTDLHVVDGELPDPKLPLVPGHEIVGTVDAAGPGAVRFAPGARVGVPWLGSTCGQCDFCRGGQENLCDGARFTGYQFDGGFAEFCVAREDFCFPIPEDRSAIHAAPLLCAGLIGYRAYRMAGAGRRLGLYGFGAAAHLLVQLARAEGREVLAFTRPGDVQSQNFARALGAAWVGDSTETPSPPLDAAILFAPVGALVPAALRAVRKGGTVVCAGIHMSDIPSFPYRLLWGERVLRSVANLTRRDGGEFFAQLERTPLRVEARTYPLEQANEALDDLRAGRLTGAAVLTP